MIFLSNICCSLRKKPKCDTALSLVSAQNEGILKRMTKFPKGHTAFIMARNTFLETSGFQSEALLQL